MNDENAHNFLYFFYSPSAKEILWSSLPFESFFGSTAAADTTAPFLHAIHSNDTEIAANEWNSCLQLKENDARHFSLHGQVSGKNVVFEFSVLCAVLSSLNSSPGLLVHVKKAMAPSVSGKSAAIYQKDYAEFIELAGHDLDAPLRKLSVLIERLVGKIDTSGDAGGYITRIQASLSDMRSMLDGLTSLATLASTPLEKENFSVQEIIDELADQLPQQYKTVTSIQAGLPMIEGDRKQYSQLFKNLLDNFIVFCEIGRPLKITISAEALTPEEESKYALASNNGYSKLVVSDNGIGFRNDYAEKIFRPFVRLHGKSEYPGHGMGLAICKRIVENHNGIIYADGKPGEGARFTLILPQTIT